MAQKKWNVVKHEKARKTSILAIPPQVDIGGHHIVLLNTVAKATHTMIPIATNGPQWHIREHILRHL